MPKFKRISYDNMKARQKENFNFAKLAATLADFGFVCLKLSDDWQGADFLAYDIKGAYTLRVQLKSRITIAKKYRSSDIWIAFPHKRFWYLVKHDRLVEKVRKHTKWLNSDSWKVGTYHSDKINPELLKSLAGNKLAQVYGPIIEIANRRKRKKSA